MAVWANADDVGTITGISANEVVAKTLVEAAGQIEVFSGAIQSDTDNTLTKRDLMWLKRAVAFQYRWLVAQPDYHERLDVTSAGQDGASANYKESALVLAPMAKRTLRRLSWRGTRSITLQGSSGRRTLALDSNGDPAGGWRKL